LRGAYRRCSRRWRFPSRFSGRRARCGARLPRIAMAAPQRMAPSASRNWRRRELRWRRRLGRGFRCCSTTPARRGAAKGVPRRQRAERAAVLASRSDPLLPGLRHARGHAALITRWAFVHCWRWRAIDGAGHLQHHFRSAAAALAAHRARADNRRRPERRLEIRKKGEKASPLRGAGRMRWERAGMVRADGSRAGAASGLATKCANCPPGQEMEVRRQGGRRSAERGRFDRAVGRVWFRLFGCTRLVR